MGLSTKVRDNQSLAKRDVPLGAGENLSGSAALAICERVTDSSPGGSSCRRALHMAASPCFHRKPLSSPAKLLAVLASPKYHVYFTARESGRIEIPYTVAENGQQRTHALSENLIASGPPSGLSSSVRLRRAVASSLFMARRVGAWRRLGYFTLLAHKFQKPLRTGPARTT